MKLLRFSHDMMLGSLAVLIGGLFLGFGLENQVSLSVQVMGHASAMIAAVGIKLGYILRLEALSRVQVEQVTVQR